MPHRSDTEALRAQLEERDRELRAAKDELDAAGQLLWEQNREAERRDRRPPSVEPLVVVAAVCISLLVLGAIAIARLLPPPTSPRGAAAALDPPAPPLRIDLSGEVSASTGAPEVGARCTVTARPPTGLSPDPGVPNVGLLEIACEGAPPFRLDVEVAATGAGEPAGVAALQTLAVRSRPP